MISFLRCPPIRYTFHRVECPEILSLSLGIPTGPLLAGRPVALDSRPKLRLDSGDVRGPLWWASAPYSNRGRSGALQVSKEPPRGAFSWHGPSSYGCVFKLELSLGHLLVGTLGFCFMTVKSSFWLLLRSTGSKDISVVLEVCTYLLSSICLAHCSRKLCIVACLWVNESKE